MAGRTVPVVALKRVTGPVVGEGFDLGAIRRHHTMLVTIAGRPKYFDVWLAVSHDGENWLDVGQVGGALPVDPTTYEVGWTGCARYVRAQVTSLVPSPAFEASVTATIASC